MRGLTSTFAEVAAEKLVGGLFAPLPPPLSWIGLKENFIFWAAYWTKPRWGCFRFPINKNCNNPWAINDIDIKLGPVTMFGKRNTVTLKKVTKTWCQQIMTLLLLFLIYGCFGAIRNTNSGRMVCDSFLLIATFYLTKSENRTKKFLTQLSYYWFQ